MTRVEKRLFVLMVGVFVALFVTGKSGSETAQTVVWITFPLVFLSHLKAADTSVRVRGPIWLRRAQWIAMGGMLLVSVLLWRVV